MRYIRVNDYDYVLIGDSASADEILYSWLWMKKKPKSPKDRAGWQVIRLSANGTGVVVAPHKSPVGYADFEIIEVGDNA